uniref:Geranylgeranyl transferase type I subunit beta n=1 Tax=Syphacia muris TaxID=451379 RepID=A0A0N5ARL9_9BILA
SRHKAALFGFEKTKAIHVQDGLAKNKHGYERHLLLRQTGNGSIWLDSLTIVNDDCLEDEALQNNAREIRQRVYSLIQLVFYSFLRNNFFFDFSRLASNCYYFVLTGCENFAYGFRGSLGSSAPTDEKAVDEKGDGVSWCIYDTGNLSQTYVALCLLIILGDDLSKVDKEAILIGVGCCQLSDGSFCSHRGSENDMRFVFTGVAICFILNDFSTVNVPKILEYIKRSINYDGGIGEGPGTESHAGSTYCAIASLHMLGSLWDNSVLSHKQIERLKKWCLMKQSEGFHGRTNKPDDSCYAYWVGATLQMLDAHSFFDHNAVRRFLMSVQDRFNGFSRETDTNPDILHTYFSIAGLSLIHEPFLCPLYSPLNVTYRTYERLLKLQAKSK